MLELNAAYVGDKPEGELAKLIKKPMALVDSKALGRLSVVDDWWFNLNLADAIKPLPVAIDWYKKDYEETIRGFVKYIGSGGYDGKSPEFEFEYEGKKFLLEIELRADKYLRPEGGERGSDYMQAREKFIVGGAWTTWAENRNDKCEPRIVKPSLVCSVSFPGEKYSRPAAVTSEEMNDVQNARDYIAGLMQPK